MFWKRSLAAILIVALAPLSAAAEHSVARQWNELMLEAIRNDFARPTVHARNLFHVSMAMYDAWAAYDDIAETVFLGKTFNGYTCAFDGITRPADIEAARHEAMSYAAYRLLKHRFLLSPGGEQSVQRFNQLMLDLGYDPSFTSTVYQVPLPATLGNYIAEQIILYGIQDGSNELGLYENLHYEPVNPTLIPFVPGNPDILDPNRWQPLTLDVFIDQSGNIHALSTPPFLSPEWGQVGAFALSADDRTIYHRDGFDYWVYHDPGTPPHLDTQSVGGISEEYKWGHSLVSIWSSHLDPADGIMWDISPGSIGNIQDYPQTFEEHRDFYNAFDGGDPSVGHALNPRTGQPYAPNIVPRGDYTRVLAEFWADGPHSETPPGHWYTILNYVNDHPLFVKRLKGIGNVLDDLEWDVKAYLILGGTVHDAAITAWGIKGWYDYIRPISAIRCMADIGQSSDDTLPNFSPGGIPLVPGYVEIVESGDPLAGDEDEHVGKIKLYAWKGPDYIDDPATDTAGVGWILAENWWPYQRPTFVTPPFAGYVSGHSVFSRAAAVAMTMLTGDEFFPGGLGEFHAPQNDFLVFEQGPSVDVTLQWATYRDASDQTSLSRIWGGIHPPADDIPGRLMGEIIGADAFDHAEQYFNGGTVAVFVTALHARALDAGVELRWELSADEALDGFRVYRALPGEREHLLTEQPLDPDRRSFLDTSARPGERYRYTLVVFGVESGEIRSAPIEVQSAPLRFSLAQNYPNPFNPTTTIGYTVPSVSDVSLRIYSTAGQLVRTLVDEPKPGGSYDVAWDGRNDAGNPVASGVYIYRLRAGTSVRSQKMTLLK